MGEYIKQGEVSGSISGGTSEAFCVSDWGINYWSPIQKHNGNIEMKFFNENGSPSPRAYTWRGTIYWIKTRLLNYELL